MQTNSRKRTSKEGTDYQYGKIPPQAVELESAVLGAIMIDPSCVPQVMGLINIESFYKLQNQLVFKACKQLYDKAQPLDILTITEQLTRSEELEQAGGPYYVTTLTDNIYSGMNAEYHCKILIEKQMKRSIIQAAQQSLEMSFDDSTDSFDCLTALELAIVNINEIMATGGNMKHVEKLATEAETEARQRESLYKSGKCTGIPTGIKQLDKRTTGWQNGELVVLAGRPSMGKTALMLHHAISAGVNVCMYSLEMSGVSLANRLILSLADLDAERFRAGAMGPEDWKQFYTAKEKLSKLPIYVDDNAVVTTRYIKSHSKIMKDKGKCDIVFIDYLQLTDMRSDQNGRNREQEVSQAAREFKIMAKSLDIPVVLLSQLSRKCEMRANKKPLLSDLRESGAIEQDADIVIFAYRPSYYGLTDSNGNDQTGIGFEIIAKGRNIGVGDIPFRHNENMTKIFDYEYSGDDQPTPPRSYSEQEKNEETPF